VAREIEECPMSFTIGENCQIHPTAVINVEKGSLGDRSIVNENVVIEGRYVEIGKEAFLNKRAYIGGGSCFDPQSTLCAGDFLHMGVDSHINTARSVIIGHECGVGVQTQIFTHGAYQSILRGFPVKFDEVHIGDHVWLPSTWVNPGVTIGNDVVVAARSLVNIDLPSGCLAGGIPVRILKENEYPRKLSSGEIQKILTDILYQATRIQGGNTPPRTMVEGGRIIIIENGATTIFDTGYPSIIGAATRLTEILKNQLRRNGIRFRFYVKDGNYTAW
jgi:acetyltransferase-like isoleucine patch superfamily enzyme